MQPLWYRNAVIYQVDPAYFRDANGDGWGDLNGIADRLEYVRGLGATCVWMLPFYTSPYRDGGYDVVDHLSVDPRFGDIADFALLMDKAEDLGLRVVIDLVAQHTSIDHPWFQQARRDRGSRYRDYYVWADEPHETGVSPIFPEVEDSVWAWDEEAQQYYRHTFYSHEPDLDLTNPQVRREMQRIMAFWLRLGVAGFRVDAVPYMVERARAADPRDDGLWLVENMRDFVTLRRPDAVLMGEVNVPVEQYADYYGNGDRMTMLLNFWSNNHTFLALARHDAEPLRHALDLLPQAPERSQHANFLRNHDELDLDRLDEHDQQELLETFAPEDHMRAYVTGIRRRLAPMLGGDERAIAMAQALLMSLPGTPVLLYGDEIGMGEDLSRSERKSVRTPMQWSNAENAGFSTADPDQLVAPVIKDGQFAYQKVNVYAQTRGEDTLLAKVSHLVRARNQSREIGFGTCTVLDVDNSAVLGLCHEMDGVELLTLVNLADTEVEVTIPDKDISTFVDVLADGRYPYPEKRDERVQLRGYGYRWLRAGEDLFR